MNEKVKNMDLKKFLFSVDNYTEVRVQENTNELIMFLNGDVVQDESSSKQGVSARSFKNGVWGFASTSMITDETIARTIEEANTNVNFLAKKEGNQKKLSESSEGSCEEFFGSNNQLLSKKDKLDLLKMIDDYIAQKDLEIVSRRIIFYRLTMEKNMTNSNGSQRYTFWPRTNIYCMISAKDSKGELVEVTEVFGGTGEACDLFSDKKDIYCKIDNIIEHLKNKIQAVYAKAGVSEVILDSSLAGILAHEAIGHTVEADLVLGGSIAADYIDKPVASELITMVDFAYEYDNELCPVPIYVDDEGTKGQDALLIENGILKSFMHSKSSGQELMMEAKGNARAYEFSDEPLIRMRNTAILPGKSSIEEMISSVKDGYYLVKTNNGQADSTGEFMFGVTVGYEIKDGKIGKAIKDTTISGVAFDVLKSVTMVSNDMKWSSGGMCGKKQPIPVGMGGPAIKCKVNIGGR